MYRGLAMYPGDACFDPTRSSLLPYWLDNVHESACKWGQTAAREYIDLRQHAADYPAPPLPPAPGVPTGGYQTGPGPTVNAAPGIVIDEIIADQTARWKSDQQAFFEETAAANPVEEQGFNAYVGVALAVGVVAAIAFLKR